MNAQAFLVDTIRFLLESTVAGGAMFREVLGYDDSALATLSFTLLLCVGVSALMGIELTMRWLTGVDWVLVPDHVLEGPPDLGFAVWPWLYFIAIVQGVGSAFV